MADALDLDICYDAAVILALEAGKIVRQAWTKNEIDTESKCTAIDLVTEFDRKVEKFLFSELRKKFPTHKFIGEESAEAKLELTDAPTWVIDPIDGTMNFVHKFPYSAICIALFVNKKVELGVVYHVAMDKVYKARRGHGAFCDNERLKVSGQDDIGQSLVLTEFGPVRDAEKFDIILKNMERIQGTCHGIRCMGSAALNMCMVARGAAEAYYEFGIHIWDMAASSIIVEEADGILRDPSGGPLDFLSRRFLCANSEPVAENLCKLIEAVPYEREG